MFTLQKPVVGRWVRRYQRKVDVKIHLFYINSYTFISYLWIIFYKMSNCDLSVHLLSLALEQTQMCHAFALNTSNTSQIYPIIPIYLWFEKWKKKEKREKGEHSNSFDIRVWYSGCIFSGFSWTSLICIYYFYTVSHKYDISE